MWTVLSIKILAGGGEGLNYDFCHQVWTVLSIKILAGGGEGLNYDFCHQVGEERGRLGPDWRYPCPANASRGSGEY